MKTVTLTRWTVIDAAGALVASCGSPAVADSIAAKIAGAKVETTEERIESREHASENDPFGDLV